MANKQKLIDYLLRVGKSDKQSWQELSLMFGFSTGDAARKAWQKYNKNKERYGPYIAGVDPYKTDSHLPQYVYSSPILTTPPTYTVSTLTSPSREEVLKTVSESVIDKHDLVKHFTELKSNINPKEKSYLLELAIFDLHIGKYADEAETGEEYNLEIAVKRYKDAINSLLAHVDINNISKILLPIGNDLLHVDNKRGTTTAGTSVDCSGSYTKMIRVAKELLINTINDLSLICPVDIVIIHGNHDTHAMYTIGEILSAYYSKSSIVNVDNSPTQRKYYSYGNVAIQFSHGNEEKHNDLGLIFATEKPHLWGLSKYRFCQLGHYHKSKRTTYISVDEFQGFQVQILPSLSGSDAWHTSKGYFSKKAAKAFLFSSENGLVVEYTHNV